MAQDDILKMVQHYQRRIENSMDDEQKLISYVKKLSQLPIELDHLSETGIGKTVNSLRKFKGNLETYASALVQSWKKMVVEQGVIDTSASIKESEKPTNYNNSMSSKESSKHSSGHSNGMKEKSKHSDFKDCDDQKEQKECKDMNGNDRSSSSGKSSDRHQRHSKSYQESRDKSSHKSKDDKHRVHSSSHSKDVRDKLNHRHKESEKESKKEKTSDLDKVKRENLNEKSQEHERSSSKKHQDHQEKSKDRYREHEVKSKERHKDCEEKSKDKPHDLENKPKEKHLSHDSKSKDKYRDHEEKSKEKHRESKEKSKEKHRDHDSKSKEKHHTDNESKGDRHKSKEGKSETNKHKDDESSSKKRKHEDSEKSSSESKTEKSRSKHDRGSSQEDLGDKPSSSSKSSKSSKGSNEHKRRRDSSSKDELLEEPKAKVTKPESQKKKMIDDEDDIDGIDSSMGANFEDVLGMLSMPSKKSKKNLNLSKSFKSESTPAKSSSSKQSKDKQTPSSSSSSSAKKSSSSARTASDPIPTEKPELLTASAKLEPLDPNLVFELPTISNNYRPLPLNPSVMECVYNNSQSSSIKAPMRMMSDSEALSHSIQSKTIRTKVYSGAKIGQAHQPSSLTDICVRFLQKNFEALEYTGGVPYEILRPILEKASAAQLSNFEEYNPYIIEDTDDLWKNHVARTYRSQKRLEMESWREMFMRCHEDQERKLNQLTETIKLSTKSQEAPKRKTQLAFVDTYVKPPRNIQRKQDIFGTKAKAIATPAARVQALSQVTPNAAKVGDARLRTSNAVRDHAQVLATPTRPKKAPLMAKTLQLMRGRFKR